MARRNPRLEKEGMRWCTKCENYLSVDEFAVSSSYKDGLDVYCKTHRAEARDSSRKKKDVKAKIKAFEDSQVDESEPRTFLAYVYAVLKLKGYPNMAARIKKWLKEDKDAVDGPIFHKGFTPNLTREVLGGSKGGDSEG